MASKKLGSTKKIDDVQLHPVPEADVTGLTASLALKEDKAQKGVASGYASLDAGATVPDAQIPASIARDTEVTAAVTAHEAAADPHPQYQRESEKGAASGYASLDLGTKVPIAQLPDASTTAKGIVELAVSGEALAGLAVQANDSRLSDARTPTAHTHTLADITDEGALASRNTVGTAQIDNDSVTYAKIQNVSVTDRVLGRSTVGAGDVEEIPLTAAGRALIDDATAADQRTTLGLGTLATQNGTFSGTSSGTNTGDQTITLTGNVTGSGTGSFVATIANDAVTYAKMQNVSVTDRVLGRATAGAGDVEEIVCTAAGRALLDDASAADQRTTLGLGALAVKSTIATADIDNLAVTYGKIQNISVTDRVLGRATAGAGVIEEIIFSAAARSLVDDADVAAMRATLDVPTRTGLNASGSWGISVTGSSASTTGNAATATQLQTARNINGVSFNGTADITVAAAAGTLTGGTLASGVTISSLTQVGTLASLSIRKSSSEALTFYKTPDPLEAYLIVSTPAWWLSNADHANAALIARSEFHFFPGNSTTAYKITASGFVGNITGSVTGNASTATQLQTARTINGVSFNGTANITITAAPNAHASTHVSGGSDALSGTHAISITGSAGSATTATTVSSAFRAASGTINVANNTWTTIFSYAGLDGAFTIFCRLAGGLSAARFGEIFFWANSAFWIHNQVGGTDAWAFDMRVSGTDIQVLQTGFGTQARDVYWSYSRTYGT